MAGRNPDYSYDTDDFEKKVNSYFKKCDNNKEEIITPDGKVIKIKAPLPYLKSGLALHVGLTTESLRLYATNPEHAFFAIIKTAYDKIRHDLEVRSIMKHKQATGCIFNLKCNHGFKETQDVNITHNEGKVSEKAKSLIDTLSET